MIQPHRVWRWTGNVLKGGGTALLNLIIIAVPIGLLVQGLYTLQQMIFKREDAIYFHPYTDAATSTAFILFLLFFVFFYANLLKNGLRNWKTTLRSFAVPLLLSVPLCVMILDSWLMVTPQGVAHSDFWNPGKREFYSWQDVDRISVGYRLDEEDDLFSGSYVLHFKDGKQLEIWNRGGMKAEELAKVDQVAVTHHIPFTVESPLSPVAKKMMGQTDWTAQERLFVENLFTR